MNGRMVNAPNRPSVKAQGHAGSDPVRTVVYAYEWMDGRMD